ncbi:MAG TPA: hypothetical protein VFF73_06725 [Planctomycetota bacterium]|nr:hypothetical protein [Planctomycetota bacterium]
MSDEDLRALERAASTDEDARLRFADALARRGDRAKSEAELRKLVHGRSVAAAEARRRLLGLPSGSEVAASFVNELEAGELCALLREDFALLTRIVLVRALRARDKKAAQALAKERATDPLASLLAADGELLL